MEPTPDSAEPKQEHGETDEVFAGRLADYHFNQPVADPSPIDLLVESFQARVPGFFNLSQLQKSSKAIYQEVAAMAANDQIHFTSYLRRIGDQVPEGLNPCPLLSGAIVTEDSMRSVCLFDVRDVDGHAVMVPDESAIFFAEPGTAITGVTRDLRFQKVQTSIHLDEQEFKRQIDQFISSDAPVRNHNLLRFMIQQALVELDITTNCAPDCIARDDNRAVIQLKSDKTVMFANFTRNAVGQFKLEIERF